MGRLRNLSQSLKNAAFHSSSGRSSPAPNSRSQSPAPNDASDTKNAAAPTVETSETPPSPVNGSSTAVNRTHRAGTFPSAMRPYSVYSPPTMATTTEHIDELRPVFSFLSSHQNKLYQEGYFLKLNDLETNGQAHPDRNWVECFAQLVGTVLSLWDAAALDAAGQDGEVTPTFINIADASIKMIETLPTRNKDVQPLQNVLSISTAGKNRYLLHFNSLHSLTQWTAGIRLAMFEHTSLQELYTGSLIAGKGKHLNNIRTIMERSRFTEEDWCRVRFGAGTPWRRCWYRIEHPDEKEWQKANKSMKKRSSYERPAYPKGYLKFYDTKKTKKAMPIATISDVYSAYAVYPQSKSLIDQSTLVKLEGRITIHSKPESQTEGFVFVMPELHPAVSGFEMMLRFLFPCYDTFTLYGRPNRLIADSLDARGLMFAMPKDRRYGYLDIMDIASLIHTGGSDKWTEREWRKRMKDLVAKRVSVAREGRPSNVESINRRSLGSRPGGVRFGDSSPTLEVTNLSTDAIHETHRQTYTTPEAAQSLPSIKGHTRSVSDNVNTSSPPKTRAQREYKPSRLSRDNDWVLSEKNVSNPPTLPSAYNDPYRTEPSTGPELQSSNASSDDENQERVDPEDVHDELKPLAAPTMPVPAPKFQHAANDQPLRRPVDRPDLRRERSRMSSATLSQLMDANRGRARTGHAGAAATTAWKANGNPGGHASGVGPIPDIDETRIEANTSREARLGYHQGAAHTPATHTTMLAIPRKEVSRPTSNHSVTRKPLPEHSPLRERPATPEDPFMSTNDRESSPDHASTQKSVENSKHGERTIGGVRKMVGDPAFDDQATQQNELPRIDFGVTHRLDLGNVAGSKPGTADRLSPGGKGISPASGVSPMHSRSTSQSPGHGPKNEYFGRSSPLPERPRPSSQLWQPGSISAGRQSPGGLTAEEFVAQRAAHARTPSGYAAWRPTSAGKPEGRNTPNASPRNKLQKKHSQHTPQQSQSRPISRSSMIELSGNLSAREQEHLAYMTGAPLINLPERSKTPDPNIGLIGAIEGREQAKRDMKQGISNRIVEDEIARRQQHWQQYHQQQQQQQQQQQYHQNYGQYPSQASVYSPSAFGHQQSQPHTQNLYSPHNQFPHQPQAPYGTQQFPPYTTNDPQAQHQYQHQESQPWGDYYAPPKGYGQRSQQGR